MFYGGVLNTYVTRKTNGGFQFPFFILFFGLIAYDMGDNVSFVVRYVV